MTAVPCVLCGTGGGFFSANKNRPARISLSPYGVTGKACHACYYAVRYRVQHGLDPATGERKRT